MNVKVSTKGSDGSSSLEGAARNSSHGIARAAQAAPLPQEILCFCCRPQYTLQPGGTRDVSGRVLVLHDDSGKAACGITACQIKQEFSSGRG